MKKTTKNGDAFLENEISILKTVEFLETPQILDDENGQVRLYMSSWNSTVEESGFVLQLRAFQPLDRDRKNRKRNLIATVRLGGDDLLWLIEQAKKMQKHELTDSSSYIDTPVTVR